MAVKFQSQEEKVNYMITREVRPLICELAVPTIISMLVTSFYNMADTFFVGQLNTQSTAAVGIVFTVMAIIQAFGFLFGHGSGVYIARKLGERDYEEASVAAATGFFMAFIAGVAVTVLGLIFLKPLAVLLGSTPTILPYTMDYMRIILIGAPFMMVSFVINNQLRYQGSASYAMIGIVAGAVINVILDPIFIFILKLGVAGAALASVIGQICSLFLLYAASLRGGNIRLNIKNVRLNSFYMSTIVKSGFPSLCRQGLASVSGIFLNHAAGNYGGIYGDAAIAAMSIVTRVSFFANAALIGFGQGFQPVCGMNYGAEKYGRVREGFWFCVKYAAIFLVIISALGFIFANSIVALFRKEDMEVIRIGALALRLQCIAFPLGSFIVIANMMLQSIGKSAKASLVASARQGLFFIPLILILPLFLGLLGVQLAQTVADVFAFAVSVYYGMGELRLMKNMETININ